MTDYSPPKWMKPPQGNNHWRLDEIKSGVIVNSYNINVPLVIFGRTPPPLPPPPPSRMDHRTDTSAIPPGTSVEEGTQEEKKGYLTILTVHESCSRLHARIAFDSNGIPWLRDLGSGNGTKVNKKSLPLQSVGKNEHLKGEGSRGVMIFPGDMIQFGASTRIFVLEGPSDFNRGAVKALQQQRRQRQQQQVQMQQQQQQQHDELQHETRQEGISWGIEFHDHNGEESHGNDKNIATHSSHVNLLGETNIPVKHQKLYNTITGKKYKLSNIQNEMHRIQSKAATMELSSGQIKQLESLEQRERVLLQQISDLEMTLSEQIESIGNSLKSCKRHSQLDDDDDNDDDDDVDGFYDKTTTNATAAATATAARPYKRMKLQHDQHQQQQMLAAGVVETEESLISKCKKLFGRHQSGKQKMSKLMTKANGYRKQLDTMKEQDEDYFYTSNDLELVMDEFEKAAEIVKQMEEEIKEVQRLLKVVNENIIVDRDTYFVGIPEQHSKIGTTSNNEEPQEEDVSTKMMPPPPPPPPPPSFATFVEKKEKQTITASSLQPVESPNLLIPTTTTTTTAFATAQPSTVPLPPPPPPTTTAATLPSSSSSLLQPPPPLRKIRGPARPQVTGTTLDFISSLSSNHTTNTNKTNNVDAIATKHNHSSLSSSSSSLLKDDDDSKTDHWVVPSSQDGSGFTKLNEKFRGRY